MTIEYVKSQLKLLNKGGYLTKEEQKALKDGKDENRLFEILAKNNSAVPAVLRAYGKAKR